MTVRTAMRPTSGSKDGEQFINGMRQTDKSAGNPAGWQTDSASTGERLEGSWFGSPFRSLTAVERSLSGKTGSLQHTRKR